MQVDILAFGAHPDDVELTSGGTLLRHVAEGRSVAIVDLTRGELGTRGTPETRHEEAQAAARMLRAVARENLDLGDGFFVNDKTSQLRVVEMVRKYRPQVVLANSMSDRHPDHGRAAELETAACFLAGLSKIETSLDGKKQEAWRPKAIYHYAQHDLFKASVIIDISDYFEKKLELVKCFKSQFHDPNSSEPQTILTQPRFMDWIRSRAMEYGWHIGVNYGEGFVINREIGARSFFDLI